MDEKIYNHMGSQLFLYRGLQRDPCPFLYPRTQPRRTPICERGSRSSPDTTPVGALTLGHSSLYNSENQQELFLFFPIFFSSYGHTWGTVKFPG